MVIKQLVIIGISGVLLACATPDQPREDSDYADAPRRSDCISEGTIRDYQVLDESNLIVTAAGNRRYHTVLSRRAFGLQSSWRLAFAGSTGRICAGFGHVLIDQAGLGAERIRIESIVQLSPEEVELLLIRFGLKEHEIEQPRVPEEVEGAGVEELD